MHRLGVHFEAKGLGFGLVVDDGGGEGSVYGRELPPAGQSQPQVKIHGVTERLVDAANRLPRCGGEEAGGLEDVAAVEPIGQGVALEAARGHSFDDTAVRPDQAARSHPAGGFRRLPVSGGYPPQGAGQQHVVRVEPGKDLPGSLVEPLVDGVGLAAIGFADPFSEPGVVAADDIGAVVGGAAVHHQVFQMGISLQNDGAQGGFDELLLIVGGGDDGDFG